MPQKHPITGCRVDTLVGVQWFCADHQLQSWLDVAWEIVSSEEKLKTYALRSAEMNDQDDEKPYFVQNGVAHLSISGPMTKHDTSLRSFMGGTSTLRAREALRQIRADQSAQKVMLHADSNGGTTAGTAELAEAVRKTNAVKPVFIHAEDAACSAMLWVATQGTRFTCGPTASVGSLGTVVMLEDVSKKYENAGVKPIVIGTGEFKGMGAEGTKLTPKQLAEIQRYVDSVNRSFANEVQSARSLNPKQMEDILTARVYVGEDAVNIGLCDAVCSTADAYDYCCNHQPSQAQARGPGKVSNLPASHRSSPMPLSADQIEQARKLPGASALTAENADAILLGIALDRHAVANSLQKTAMETDKRLALLQAEVPVALDPTIAKGHIDLACKSLDLTSKQEKIMPAQLQLLKNAIMPAGKANTSLVSSNGDVMIPFSAVAAAMELNQPAGLVNEISNAQESVRTEPGKAPSEIDAQEQNWSLNRCNTLRAAASLEPFSPDEFAAKYPKHASNGANGKATAGKK